jgi:methionyl-tRNA synthetase
MRDIMALADRANQYIDTHKPWLLARQPGKAAEVQAVCTQGLNLFRVLMIYLQPVLPLMAVEARRFLRESDWTWRSASNPLLGTTILPYEPLATRLDAKVVSALIEPAAGEGAAKAAAAKPVPAKPVPARTPAAPAAPTPATAPAAAAPGAPADPPASISIDEFLRVDLRVARVLEAGLITGADKLLKLRLDVGDLGERQIFAGIRAAYEPQALVGRLIVVVANLKPRKMRFGTSEGMMLAAGPGGTEIFVLSPDSGAAPGMRVK